MDTPNAIIGTLTPEEIAEHLAEPDTTPMSLEERVSMLERRRATEIEAYQKGVNDA